MLVRAWQPFGLDSKLTLDLLNFLIPVLLLTGMVHIETLFKERLRLEEEEKRLRTGLESQVQARTAELGKANDELIRFLADLFGVPRRNVLLLRGETSRAKTVRVIAPRKIPSMGLTGGFR